MAVVPTSSLISQQRPEVRNNFVEVPPKATLWGQVFFLSDEPVELVFKAGNSIKTLRGRIAGTRMAEYSWENSSNDTRPVIIRARALAGDRELPSGLENFRSTEQIYIAFGRRGMPEAVGDRKGSYPYEAAFIGFFLYGE